MKVREPFQEGFFTDMPPNHVPEHQALAVAHRLGRRGGPAAELHQREVRTSGDIRELLEGRATVERVLRPMFCEEMIGHIGREPLGPVATVFGHRRRVAPPSVEDLVGIAAREHPGKADDLGTEQGEPGHSVACIPEVLDEGETFEGVGREHRFVEEEGALRRGRVAIGEARVLLS